MYRVSVDASRCQGHARCLAFAPEIFASDDDGNSYVPEDRAVLAELGQSVRRAIANCPEGAIRAREIVTT